MFLREAGYVPVALVRQYGSVRGLRRRQLRQLNRMLAYCRARVPHYRDDPRYATGPLRTLDEVARLPLLTRQDLRERPWESFIADGVDPGACVNFSTSGTTGRRLRVVHDHASFDYHTAACVRRFTATGRYLPTDRLSHLRVFAPPARAFERLGLFRRHVIGSYLPLAEIKRALLGNRPRVIIGYPVHLRELLRGLEPGELERLRRTLRMVMTESELLVPEHREALQRGFGVPVFDEYSAYEVLNISYECRHGGCHAAEDRSLVEVVDDGGVPVPDGVEGWLVVTHFRERAMPLLRYHLGDAGVIEPGRCRCGRRFRRLRLTRGRREDVVALPDGRRLYSDTFLELAARHPGITECFVRHDGDGRVRVHVVPDGSVAGATLPGTVRGELFGRAGGPFPLEVVLAERVPITDGGKGRFVQSELLAVDRPVGPVEQAGAEDGRLQGEAVGGVGDPVAGEVTDPP